MEFKYFKIKNFKGIKELTFNLDKSPNSNIYTLVGLNESGKTTVLEAINQFYSSNNGDENSLKSLSLPRSEINDYHEMIPVYNRDNFNDNVIIEAQLAFNNQDLEDFKKYLLNEDFKLTSDLPQYVTIKKQYLFESSRFIKASYSLEYSSEIMGKEKGKKKAAQLADEKFWNTATFLESLMPNILYFPNFLFDFPDKIYLTKAGRDSIINQAVTSSPDKSPLLKKDQVESKNEFYRMVIQDILDSLEKGLKIQEHIVDRVQSKDPNDKKNLEALLLKVSNVVTNHIIKSWSNIFGKTSDLKFKVQCNEDVAGVYLEFNVVDGDSLYSISERSLGFRWYFVFAILTIFRGFRRQKNNKILFLLDEPASNLHSTAQQKLLEAFQKITEKDNCKIIYTTHSHHLIKPDWLESAYVVMNKGIDYESNPIETGNVRETDINLERYREFASKTTKDHNKHSYFQPILDLLDYRPSILENVPNVIFVEGKNDFYTLNYFNKVLFKIKKPLKITPGKGSGSLDPLISLYLGWGMNFIILLDDDKEGHKQKARYIKNFGKIVEDVIYTLRDIDKTWNSCAIESLFDGNDKLSIQKSIYTNTTIYDKDMFNRAIQELFLTNKEYAVSEETKQNFQTVLDFLENKITSFDLVSV